MQNKLSDDLIMISTMMMVAKERREFISLANEVNATIQKALEIEKSGIIPQENRKTLSATIKFTKQEIDKMSKTFKKEFIANGYVAHIIKRPSGKKGEYYEIRYRRNGYNISVSNKDLKKAKQLFIEETHYIHGATLSTNNKLEFKTIFSEWLEVKMDIVTIKTCNDYKRLADNSILNVLGNKNIKEIRTADLKRIMPKYKDNPRKYEEMRSVLNQTFNYAIASGIISHNPVTLIPFKRAERENRDSLSTEQIRNFLTNIKKPQFNKIRQGAYIFYFFGIRPCELDEEARFENGFLFCRNRKRKDGKIEYKKIPIPKQAQGLIDFDKPITFQLSYSGALRMFKKVLGDGLTPYNLRHTFASLCSETVRQDIVEVWMGDSPERLIGRVYVHFPDEFMREQMDKVEFLI